MLCVLQAFQILPKVPWHFNVSIIVTYEHLNSATVAMLSMDGEKFGPSKFSVSDASRLMNSMLLLEPDVKL